MLIQSGLLRQTRRANRAMAFSGSISTAGRRAHANFAYKVAGSTKARRVVAKVERRPGLGLNGPRSPRQKSVRRPRANEGRAAAAAGPVDSLRLCAAAACPDALRERLDGGPGLPGIRSCCTLALEPPAISAMPICCFLAA